MLRKLPTAASGACVMSFSHSGLMLAAACGDPATNVYRIIIYK